MVELTIGFEAATFVQLVGFYTVMVCTIAGLRLDAWVLHQSRRPEIFKNAYAWTDEGRKNRAYLCSTAISTVNALVSATSSVYLYSLWREQRWWEQSAKALTFATEQPATPGMAKVYDLTHFLCVNLAAYFAVDLVLEVKHVALFKNYSMILHHLVFFAACLHNAYYKVFAFQFCWLIFGELSTPFINLRWILATLGRKQGKLYMVNAVVFMAAFSLSRLVVYTLGLRHLWQTRSALEGRAFSIRLGVPGLLVAGYVLNLYWATKIVKGFAAMVRAPAEGKRRE